MKSQEPEICLQHKKQSNNMKFDIGDLLCLKGNDCAMLCQNKNCLKKPFICIEKDCQCQQTHKKCLKIMSEQFFTEINQKIVPTQTIKQRVETIINEAIDYISKIRDQIQFNLKYLGLNQQEKDLIHKISVKEYEAITGAKVWKVSQTIYEQKQISSTYIIKQINKFWQQSESKFKNNFLRLKQLADKESPNLAMFLDSQIIKSPNQVDTLFGFFKNDIVKTKLLYSAKKSNYNMRSYLTTCCGQKNTLLLVKSKEGKIFGGFYDKQIKKDQNSLEQTQTNFSRKSFVFSLTNNDKFLFNQEVQVPLNTNSMGPNFGSDFLGIYKHELPKYKLHQPIQNLQPNGAFGFGNVQAGFGGFGQPQAFGQPAFNFGVQSLQQQLTQHYCVVFESKCYKNQKYASNEESRIRFTGHKQRMFPIEEWQVHQIQFAGNYHQ